MYKDYAYLSADHLLIFGGHQSYVDFVGAFRFCVGISSTFSGMSIGSRLIIFGD